MTKQIAIRRPDDMHLHLRDGAILQSVLPFSSRDFARAITMPNLVPPVRQLADALAYKERILACLPFDHQFEPLMTLYLTEETRVEDIDEAVADRSVRAVKLYPAGVTTNSGSGVQEIGNVMNVLERMAYHDVPLLVHGEVTDPEIDIFDREAVFIDRVLLPLRAAIPNLRIVMEHVTTRDGVDFVRSQASHVAATITVHHLLLNRNAMLAGGIRPHYYCLPVLKREEHRRRLVSAATSGDPRFFLGTDSAPHTTDMKEHSCGCAGVFTAANALAWLAHIFEAEQALERLEAFTSIFGAQFYGLPLNEERIVLARQNEPVLWPGTITVGDGNTITVFDPGFSTYWRVQS